MGLENRKFKEIERSSDELRSKSWEENREDVRKLSDRINSILSDDHIERRNSDIDQKWIRDHEVFELNKLSTNKKSKFSDLDRSRSELHSLIDSLPKNEPIIPERENLLDEIDSGRSR